MSRQRRNPVPDGTAAPGVSEVAEEAAAASGTGLNLKVLKEKKISELAADRHGLQHRGRVERCGSRS